MRKTILYQEISTLGYPLIDGEILDYNQLKSFLKDYRKEK
jgi:hypothetical protein